MSGLYVACWLGAADADALHLPAGEPAERLHVTLAYLGDVDELPAGAFATAADAVQAVAATAGPLDGTVPGYGMFRGGENGDVFWAAVDVPGLAGLRQRICDRLAAAALPPVEPHGWTPHVTLAYLEPGTFAYLDAWEPRTLRLESVTLTTSGDERRETWPLGRATPPPPDPTSETEVQFLKAETKKRIVWGIVLEPEVEDSHGDIVSADDVELAAHRFLYGRCPIGLQHIVDAPEAVRPVESYIAPVDFTVDTARGPERVRKGSWVLAAHIPDEELWSLVEREGFTGWSIAGWGTKTPV